MDRKEKINQKYFKIIQNHYKEILNLFSINDNDILFISGAHIIRITNTYIDFFIFNKLKTKKNNYTIRMNIDIYNAFIKKLGFLIKSTNNKNKLKQEVINLAKGLYRVGKDDSVIISEKVCMSIFEFLKDIKYDYKIKLQIDNKNITIYYNGGTKKKLPFFFFLIISGLNKFDFKNLKIREETEINKNINIKQIEILDGNNKKNIKENLIKVLKDFFNNPFFKEEYYYITDIKTKNEKDLSNTIELFNDVIQTGLTYINENIKFDDRQIIEIHGKKLYYDKNVKDLLQEMYIFRFYPV